MQPILGRVQLEKWTGGRMPSSHYLWPCRTIQCNLGWAQFHIATKKNCFSMKFLPWWRQDNLPNFNMIFRISEQQLNPQAICNKWKFSCFFILFLSRKKFHVKQKRNPVYEIGPMLEVFEWTQKHNHTRTYVRTRLHVFLSYCSTLVR